MSSDQDTTGDAALGDDGGGAAPVVVAPAAPVKLVVRGDFSFTLNRNLQDLLQLYPRGERAFEVDLAAVSELDSSALGMLLQLRDHSRDGDGVTIINASAPVRAALAEAEVGRLFPVNGA